MGEIRLNRGNIFTRLPADRSTEHFDALAQLDKGHVERIVSVGHCSPEGFWYDQDHSEWVLLLRGHAKIQVEGVQDLVELTPGDYVSLAAHTRHRVAWTSLEEPTIWLAIHY